MTVVGYSMTTPRRFLSLAVKSDSKPVDALTSPASLFWWHQATRPPPEGHDWTHVSMSSALYFTEPMNFLYFGPTP